MPNTERVLLYLGLLVGAVLLFQLSARYGDLADAHSALRERAQWPHAGYSVPTFAHTTIDGDSIRLGERTAGRQLVFFFSTTCEYCLASLPAWRSIAVDAATHGTEVVGVAVDRDGAIREYRDRHTLAFPITTFPDDKLARLYRAGNVPLVALLDETGRVLYSRVGVLDSALAIDSVRAALQAPVESVPPVAQPESSE